MQAPKKSVIIKGKRVKNFFIDTSQRLGSGQQAEVFTATNEDTGQQFAVKIFKRNAVQKNEKSKEALLYQIQIMQSVRSPNIIQFIGCEKSENHIYIFQEKANQGTLADFVRQKPYRRMQQGELIQCISQLLNGFIELQRHGIMHRDIKPTNILVKDNVFKIADFGMSRYSGSIHSVKTEQGTPIYMAPQITTSIIQNKPCFYTEKCDIWSLGILSFQLLTGKCPWVFDPMQKSQRALLKSIRDQSTIGVNFPSNINASQNLKNFIRGCAKYEQEDRFSWSDVFNHPIFQNKFKDVTLNLQNYVITDLRLKIHSENINVETLLSYLPQQIDKKMFQTFIKMINKEITKNQSYNLFKVIASGKSTISQKSILAYFKSHQIKVKGLIGKMLPSQKQQFQKNLQIEKQIAKGVKENHVDLFKIYKKFATHEQVRIGWEQFSEIATIICPKANKQQIKELFNHFNTQNTLHFNFNNFYQQLCQAAQMPAVKEQEISEEFRKFQHKS